MQDLADEEPDAAHLAEQIDVPEEAEVPEWAEWYVEAWHALRFDRQYGAFGGETPISFLAIDAYAARNGIGESGFDLFRRMLVAMDEEWLKFVAEKAPKAEPA